jgi:glycosyltransferase involved in cell wall biosynthesis
VPLIEAVGWDHGLGVEVANPYISAARANMTRKALDAGADVVMYLDYDLSWPPLALLRLLLTPGDVVAGAYRFKKDDEEYMAQVNVDDVGRPVCRADGCISTARVAAGFLKLTRRAITRFGNAYPHLLYGPADHPSVDLFNHGAHKGVWWGEDYAFCRNWTDAGGDIWIVPDLDIDHHAGDKVYPGNFHKFLMAQPQPVQPKKEPLHG